MHQLSLWLVVCFLALCTGSPCNISGAWEGVNDGTAITVSLSGPPSPTGIPFTATAVGHWANLPGWYYPLNSTMALSFGAGLIGSITTDCSEIQWKDSNHDSWGRPGPPNAATLSTPLLSLGVTIAPSGAVSISTFSFFGAGANTTNFALHVGPTQDGTTLLRPASSSPEQGGISPTCGPRGAACTLTSTPTLIALTGLALGDFARENWTLVVLNTSAISWRVDRAYTGVAPPPTLTIDRMGLSLQTTGGTPIHAQQIPGFVDLDMFMNDTSSAGFDLGNGAFQFLSPHATQFVRFTPTGSVFVIEGVATTTTTSTGAPPITSPSPLLWSFAKPFADGTAWCSIGFEAIDPRGSSSTPSSSSSSSSSPPHGHSPTPGSTTSRTLTLHLVETDIPVGEQGKGAAVGNFPALSVSLPNATLGAAMDTLFSAQYQLMGWIVGNNPASVPCLHEAAWWPLMASVLNAGSPAFAAMQRELTFFARCGWSAEEANTGGYEFGHTCNVTVGAEFGLTHRFASSGFYNAPWGPLMDENVMFPIAVYYAAVSSGDLVWLQSLRPALNAMEAFLASRGLTIPSPQAVFTSPASGLADGGRHAGNWYDIVLFGHFDAFLAVHGVWAMWCLAEIYAALGDAPASAHAAAVHAQASVDFNALFWNDTSRAYMDWIDTAGVARHYFYTDIGFTAIIAGVANATQTQALLSHYDQRLAEIYVEYNVTPGSIWSSPSNLYPITNPKELANSDGSRVPFPSYENGGSFFHTPGLQFAALGAAGRGDDAYTGFETLLNSGFNEVRGWAQQLYWGHDGAAPSLVGGDPLNTAALAVWGFLRGAFGVVPTLNHGLQVVNTPAAKMEGGVWNTSFLGESVCLTVVNARAMFCNGSVVL